MKKLILPTAIFLFSASVRAEYVNDFHCYLHEGYTVPSLFEFQQEWMQAAKEKGFDETYRTRVLFPVYNAETSTDPVYFIWRGFFKDGAQWGRMSDWFLASPWAAKFNEVMNCKSSSLWTAPV